jgi:hypothetical protein
MNGPFNMGEAVREALESVAFVDMHTHLFPGSFTKLNLSGIDELLTYHYLVAEALRLYPEKTVWFWRQDKVKQADWIWRVLFLERTPLSEACRGVLTLLQNLHLEPFAKDLSLYREYFRDVTPETHADKILALAHLRSLVMTNDPFDETENEYWQSDLDIDPRFRKALRLDLLLNEWSRACRRLQDQGYAVVTT